MKNLFGSLLIFISITAFAKGKESPSLYADLQETDKDGNEIIHIWAQSQKLTLNKVKEKATSFDWTEQIGTLPATQMHFKIMRTMKLECGSKRFIGYSEMNKSILSVVDHSSRVCDDFRPNKWEVVLRQNKSSRYFRGNPKPVDNGIDCRKTVEGTACIMLYAPADCQLVAYDGKPVEPPLRASGSNSCFAVAELKVAACERGLDSAKILDDNIICSVNMPLVCPIPMCAAPPEGCTSILSDALDANGCPANPCGILSCPAK